MAKYLMTKDQIALAGLRNAIALGLTKSKDQKVSAKAFCVLLELYEFIGDFDTLPICTAMAQGVRERLSKKGRQQFDAAIGRQVETGLMKVCEVREVAVS